MSSRGFALGYLGGGLLLLANLVPRASAPALGISGASPCGCRSLRRCVVGRIRDHHVSRLEHDRPAPRRAGIRSHGRLCRLRASFRALRRLPQTRRYLLAYMLFNDGIQTVIAMASLFLSQELFVARGLPETSPFSSV